MSKSETSDFGGERRKQSRSRGVWAPEFCQATKPSHEAVCVNARPCRRGREAERRKAHCPTVSAPTDKSAKLVCARLRAVSFFCGTPPFGARACGPRRRLLPRWLSSRTGFPAAAADGCFPRFANPKKKHAAVKHAPCGPVFVPVDRGPSGADLTFATPQPSLVKRMSNPKLH